MVTILEQLLVSMYSLEVEVAHGKMLVVVLVVKWALPCLGVMAAVEQTQPDQPPANMRRDQIRRPTLGGLES